MSISPVSGQPTSGKSSPNIQNAGQDLELLLHRAHSNLRSEASATGYPTSTGGNEGGPATVLDDQGDPMPALSDPTGEAAINTNWRANRDLADGVRAVWSPLSVSGLDCYARYGLLGSIAALSSAAFFALNMTFVPLVYDGGGNIHFVGAVRPFARPISQKPPSLAGPNT